jgi:hypothetical protein
VSARRLVAVVPGSVPGRALLAILRALLGRMMMIAVLPKGSKPTKGASSDETRPILCRGELVELGADQWVVDVTDSYKLVRIPLDVKEWDDTPALVAGPVSADALKAIEKAGAFTADADTVSPWQVQKHGGFLPADGAPAFARAGADCEGQFPNVGQLMPDGDVVYRFGLNAALLLELVQSVGPLGKSGRGATVVFEYRARNFDSQVNVHATTVSVGEHRDVGLIMPIRVDQPRVISSVVAKAFAAEARAAERAAAEAVATEAPADDAPAASVPSDAFLAAACEVTPAAPVDVDRAALADVNAVLDAAVSA